MNPNQSIQSLLTEAIRQNASDLHITVDRKPTLRVNGALVELEQEAVITADSAKSIIAELLPDALKERFIEERQIDFAYALPDNTRFRVNAYFEQGTWSAALRLVPAKIRTLDELNLPPILHEFTKLTQGFVLMVGPAGQGKSTTMAALLDEISKARAVHIVTIEDPIEYVFQQNLGIVSQREVGADTHSFADGLRTVLRQDPDVIMVGEMRDAESIAAAMTAAETGHLVFSTLHTNSASQTVDRIIDTFPADQQDQIVTQAAATIVAIVSERLIPRIGGGRVPALEVMIMNPAIRNLIRERKIFSIDSVIQTGLKEGMMTLDYSLATLVKQKLITLEDAERHAANPDELKRYL